MPPWPHEDVLGSLDHAANPFRSRHGLEGKFVVMYSGNHSPANPITTVLDAADRLRNDERLVFLFIGGGAGKKEVEERIARGARNIRSLPYQPLAELKYSLSAADLHVVSMGDDVVGIVHPCKVYGAMAVSRPILLLGPDPCHVSDLIVQHRIGRNVRHGDVEGCSRAIRELAGAPAEELAVMGRRAAEVIATTLSKDRLCGRFCDVMQRGMPAPTVGAGRPTR
jgi:glycosyltransferase involved in cell wall biosynthesis